MLKNEIRAEMDVVKIGIQSLIAFLFALLLLAVQGYVKPLELYASITVLAGAVNLRFDHLQDIAEPFELRFPFYRIGWLP
jgi:hypothetical protein